MANLGGTPVAIPQIGEEYIPHGLYVARCRLGFGDTTETSTSGSSNGYDRWTDTQETVPLFDINSTGVFVHNISWDVETAFTASVTFTLGDGQHADGYAAAADVSATVISTGCAYEDTSAGNAYNRGRRYPATDAIDIVVGGADPAVGCINVYCIYSYAPEYAQPDTGGSANT